MIGVYALLKMAVISRWGVVVMGPLFLGHYGAFMAIHFMAVYYLFVRGIPDVSPEPASWNGARGTLPPASWPALLQRARYVSSATGVLVSSTIFSGPRESPTSAAR